ncbi:MAG TPA: Clp protease N-terminal domain-containing protein [Jatrophihabitantaceae bacterium]|jgi:ATP-dependent Clp protease ATP-binding subunit ClpC
MFEVFTVGAREVVVYAQDEARELGHPHIGTEHLLLGLLRDEADPTGQALRATGITRATVRVQLTELVGMATAGRSGGPIPFTDRAKRVLTNALRVSQRFKQSHIDRPHLLYSLLEVRDGMAVRVLTELGVDVDGLATTARDLAAPAT